ncbi:hypothetical protein PspLS_01662 [Pyricularia sp. CBS 133598]|nr:hypothetical protein PspLS_01662 [Pyricularia sp. CBS 133598]
MPFPYIGCSKKACLLCEAFLDLAPGSPSFRVRGRYGECFFLWDIPRTLHHKLSMPLESITGLLPARIARILLQDARGLLAQAVAQSITISSISDPHLASQRREVKKMSEELQEKRLRL